MRSSAHPANFQAQVLRSPEPTSVRRPASIDRYGARSGTVQGDLPYPDPQARYSISYVPGMSEHVVNTGKTLPEAQLKVVLLSCEIERLNTMNYNLVKENEVLNARNKRSDREIDLENKLAIVLAENEKLNQIVEELHGVYARERESLNNEDYERRIAELLQDLEEWKHKYNRLEGEHPGSHDFKHTIDTLTNERELLREQLGRQGRDLEALRARLASIQVGPADTKLLQEQITYLKIENEKLSSELATMKLKYGNADALQERLSQYDQKLRVLLSENEKLNNLLVEQSRDLQASQREIAAARNELLSQSQQHEERVKRAVKPGQDLAASTNALLEDNNRLNRLLQEKLHQIEELNHRIRDLEMGHSQSAAYREKLSLLTTENERLNNLVHELRAEIERVRLQAADATKINQLTAQIHSLLEENRRLNDLVVERSSEVDRLRRRITELETQAGDTTKITQLTTQIHGLLDENTRLNHLIGDLKAENDRLRATIAQLEGGSSQLTELRGKLTLLAGDNDKLNHVIADLRAEVERLHRQLSEAGSSHTRIETLNIQITQLNSQLTSLTEENRRLNALILERAREIEQLRLQASEGRASAQQLASLAEENRRLASLLEEARNRYLALEKDSHEVVHLRSRITSLTSEIERLGATLSDRNREIDEARRKHAELAASLHQVDDLRSKLLLLTQENERLNNIIVDKLRESDSLKVRISSLESSGVQIHSLEDRIHHLTGERDRLNGLLLERIKEIDVLKDRINELQASAHHADSLRSSQSFLSTENERLNSIIAERLREIDALRARIVQLEGSGAQVGELKSKIELLIRENTRLNDALIERAKEIDVLRRRLTELEASSQNYLTIQNRYSILLADSQSAIQERDTLKAQLALVIAERDRLNILLSEKVAECDSLRTRHSKDLEASPSRTRESITRASNVARQDQATEQLKRVYEEAIQNLEQRVKLLDSEVTRLIGVLADRDHELETWRGRSKEFAFTTQENQRLNQLLTDRLREIEDLRREIPSPGLKRGESERAQAEAEYKKLLEAQLSEVSARNAEERQRLLQQIQELTSRLEVVSADNQRLSVTVNQAHQENESWKSRYEQLERQRDAERQQELERRAHESPKRAHHHVEGGEEQISEKVDFLNHEIERLQEHLNNTLKELEDWRKKYSELEILRTQELDALRHQFEDSKRFTIEAREVSTKFNAERAAYEAQIGQLQQRVVDTEAQLRLIASENERVLRLSNTRSTEAEESKRKYQELKSSQSIEINQLRSQVEAFKANATDVKQLAIKYSADKAADQSQIKQLKQVNENYKTEIEKLYELIEQRKADFENLTVQNQEVLANFERLSEELRQHTLSTYSNQEKLEISLREVQDLKASRDEFKQQAERNSTELTRKNKELIDRIQEIDVLKLRYEESLANYHALNVKLFEKLSH